jgi:ribosome assembly protein YihI (activator of Der GTPase)
VVDGTVIGARGAAEGAASGREAGESRDGRIDGGSSRALPGTPQALPEAALPGRSNGEKQADMRELATFDNDAAMSAVATRRAAAAAIPPATTRTPRLTPAEAAYVRAWTTTSLEP